MNILNLFIPRTYKFPDSHYNKNISVLTYLNSTTLLVDSLVESGDIMTHIWKKGIKKLLPQSFKPRQILLLGLAGGCNAHLINRFYPEAHITAIEIDPFMVKLGKKFFHLDQVKNLKIIIADALDYANNLQEKDQFDLVMVDCFVGKQIPEKLESVSFFKKLKDHSRYVLINRLWWRQEYQKSAQVLRILSTHFFVIKTHTISNAVISLV